jgi:hypothetical protein
MTITIEGQIAQLDLLLAEGEKQAKAVLKRIQGLRKRAASGELGPIPAALEQIPQQTVILNDLIEATRAALTYDTAGALADGSYLAELKAEASARNVVLTERDGRLSAFPLMLKLEPRSGAVRVGRKLERQIRPSALIETLRKAQISSRFDAARFLDQVFRAYEFLARIDQPKWDAKAMGDGPVVQLADIHAILTLLPIAAGDYAREEFACDLLRLDREPDTRTRGMRFSLPASTGSKGRSRLNVFDETGEERVFVGIRFSRDSTP